MIHPSLIEKISLDERQANAAVVDDLKRSYPYVGPVTVGTHAATEPPCNVMRLVVRMGKPYWSSADATGDEMWDAVRTWLDAKLYKVGSTMANFNTSRAEKGQQTVDYGRLELDMKPYLFSVALPTTGALPEAEELVGRFRELLNAGVLEGAVVRVDMPAAASWAEQCEAARERAEAQAAAEQQAGEEGAANEEGAAAYEGENAAEPEGVSAAEPEQAPVEEEPAPVPVVLESVDYRLWDVAFEDGSVRTLDSAAGAWL